jgi:hypothetical protein
MAWPRLRRLWVATVPLGALIVWQVHTPKEIPWASAPVSGCRADKADGLVIQQVTTAGIWATRGYDIYLSRDGGPFNRLFSLRPPFGEAWAGYSSSLRSLYGYQELVEVVPVRADVLLAFAGGAVYRVDIARQRQEEVLALRYFGRGRGRGIMSRIAVDREGQIFFGEYTTLYGPHSIRLWRSSDEGRTWTTAHEFEPGFARHIHGVEWDPYGEALWLMTGDADAEVHLGWSTDGGEQFTWIGEHDQRFRACSLIFRPDTILWGTDAPEDNHLMRWTRASGNVDAIGDLPAQSLYSQSIDSTTAVVSQSSWDAAVYLVRADASLQAITRFTPLTNPDQPLPGVRLARGEQVPSSWVFLNPLRTREDESAIYRVAVADLNSCSPRPWSQEGATSSASSARSTAP